MVTVTSFYGLQLDVSLSGDRTVLTVCGITDPEVGQAALTYGGVFLAPDQRRRFGANPVRFDVPQAPVPQDGCVAFAAPFTAEVHDENNHASARTVAQFPSGLYRLELRFRAGDGRDVATFVL